MVRDFYTTWKHMFIGLIGGKSVVWFFTGFHMFQLTCWRYFVKPKLWPNRFSPEIELQDLSPRPHRLQRKWMKDLLNGKSKICASIVVGYHRISCKNFFRRESSECLNVPRTKSSRNILTKKTGRCVVLYCLFQQAICLSGPSMDCGCDIQTKDLNMWLHGLLEPMMSPSSKGLKSNISKYILFPRMNVP